MNLSGTNSLSLLLSLTECSSVRQLNLQGITGAAGTPELVVQVLRCMPLLQELVLEDIQSPVLERVSGLVGWEGPAHGAEVWVAHPAAGRAAAAEGGAPAGT